MEPWTIRRVLPQTLHPQKRLAVQHHSRPVRAAGPVRPEARCGPTAAGPTRLLQPNSCAGLFPPRRPSSQPQPARRGLGALGGRRGGRGGKISGSVQERSEQPEEEEEEKVPRVQAADFLPETEHQDDVQPDLRRQSDTFWQCCVLFLIVTSSLPGSSEASRGTGELAPPRSDEAKLSKNTLYNTSFHRLESRTGSSWVKNSLILRLRCWKLSTRRSHGGEEDTRSDGDSAGCNVCELIIQV